MSTKTQDILNLMIGKTFTKIEESKYEIFFHTSDGDMFHMYHDQDCCESVTVEDIIGNIKDLIDSPILMAEEVKSHENPHDANWKKYQDSFTWTFYKFATIKGYVTIRWYGESNGCYSESVDLSYKKENR